MPELKPHIPGKTTRGVSGYNNALSIPFRKGGRPCNYDTKSYQPTFPGGDSKMVTAVLFSTLIDGGKSVSNRLLDLCEKAAERCTSPVIT